MKLKPSSYFAMALMLMMLVIIVAASTFRFRQAALLPFVFGGLVFVLSGVQLWRELSGREAGGTKKKEKRASGEGDEQPTVKGGSLGMLALWILGFSAAIYLLGYLVALPLFLLSYVRWRGRSWVAAIVMAVALTGFLYGLFDLALGIKLYPGLIFELIFGRLYF